jgi:hypothetical protein
MTKIPRLSVARVPARDMASKVDIILHSHFYHITMSRACYGLEFLWSAATVLAHDEASEVN